MKFKFFTKYAIFFANFLLFFYAEESLGISAFAIAIFMALVYCKQNVLILTPLYIIAGIIFNPTLSQLIIILAPPVVISLAYFLHFKLKKKVKLLAINIYTLIAQIPLLFLRSGNAYDLTSTVISILGSQIFTYIVIAVAYSILVRGLRYRLRTDEFISYAVYLGALGMAFATIEIFNFYPIYVILAVVVLLSSLIDPSTTMLLGASIGLGASIAVGTPSLIALTIIYAICANMTRGNNIYLSALTILVANLAFNVFFQQANFTYLDIIATAVGCLIVILLPNRAKLYLSNTGAFFREKYASKSIVNRNKQELSSKINSLASIFFDMQDILQVEYKDKDADISRDKVVEEVCNRCCSSCLALDKCTESLGGSPSVIIIELVDAAINRGKASILDTPPYLSSRCKKVNGLIQATNEYVAKHRQNKEVLAGILQGKKMIAEQMGGVGQVLTSLANSTLTAISYDTALEKSLLDKLSYGNIIASEVAVYGAGSSLSINLVVREQDSNKHQVLDILSDEIGCPIQLISTSKCIKGNVTQHFSLAPKFSVSYSTTSSSLIPTEVCGDNSRIVKIDSSKVMIILSDGMGSGINAYQASTNAIAMIESFYKAGFDHNTVLSSVSKMLSLREREDFNAVDIAIIDTSNGATDLIKLGGREGYIVRQGKAEVVNCGSLPMGIVDDIEPIVEQRNLNEGDYLVLISDGVADVLDEEKMIELLEDSKTTNPETISQMIIANARRLGTEGERDDAMCIIARLIAS